MDIRQHATSNYMHRFNLGSGLAPPRPRRPLAFVQTGPMGVTPLEVNDKMPAAHRKFKCLILTVDCVHLRNRLMPSRGC